MASDLQARLREATAGNERLCIENDRLRSRLTEAERLLREVDKVSWDELGFCLTCDSGHDGHVEGLRPGPLAGRRGEQVSKRTRCPACGSCYRWVVWLPVVMCQTCGKRYEITERLDRVRGAKIGGGR